MKIKREFAIRNMGDKWVAVSLNDDINNTDLLITMSSESAFLFGLMENDIDYYSIIKAIVKKYDLSEERAKKEFDGFLDKLRKADLLQEQE